MPYPYAYPSYMPPFMNGGEYIRAHGYPTNDQFMDVKIPTAPITDPLKSGVQFGLLGAASGLGFSAIRRARDGAPGGWPVVRDAAIGAALGTIFGALAAKENQKRWPTSTANSYSGVARTINATLGKAAMEKQAILPLLLPALGLAFGAWGAYDAARSGGRMIGALGRGQFRQAAGHGLATLGNLAMAIPGAGSAIRVAKGVKMVRPLVRPMQKGLNMAARANKAMYATGGRTAMSLGGTVAAQSVGQGLARSAPNPMSNPMARPMAPTAPRPAVGANLLRMVPQPQAPQFRTLV